MKLEHYQKRVEESKEFRDFKKKNKKAYLAAGFFVLDFEGGKNMHQIDYALPNGKIATFILDEGVKFKVSDQAIKKPLPEIKPEIKTDLEALKGIVEDEMKNRIVTESIKKIIAVLHILDNKPVWNLQCILDGLSLLNVHVDDKGNVLKFEKHSLMEMIKKVPGLKMQQQAEQGKDQTQVTDNKQEVLKKIQEKLDEMKKQQAKPQKSS